MLSVLRVDALETKISVFAIPVFCDSVTPESFSSNHTSEPHYKCGKLMRLKGEVCNFVDVIILFHLFRENFTIYFIG